MRYTRFGTLGVVMSEPTKAESAASEHEQKLPASVIVLGWVSFFADVSGEMIYPLLPLFLVGVLGATATSLGWVEGIAQATVALLTAWAGWHSDRRRRRVPYVRWGYGLPVIGKSILALAFAWPMVLAGRIIDRLGKGLRASPRDALLADAVPKAIRGRAFGLHRAMDTAGAMVGTLVSAMLLWWLVGTPAMASSESGHAHDATSFRMVFAIAAGLGLVSLALTFLLREVSPAKTEGSDEPKGLGTGSGELGTELGVELGTQLGTELGVEPTTSAAPAMSRAYWIVMAMLMVFALANSSDTFLLLRAADLGLAPWVVVLAYAFYNLTYTIFSYPAGVLSDRIGRWKVIAIGWAVYATVYVGFAILDAGAVWPLFAAYGVFMALTDGVAKALIADHAPAARRGFAIGLFYMGLGAATLVSSVIAGLLWDRVSHQAPFWFGAGAALVSLAILPVAARMVRSQD